MLPGLSKLSFLRRWPTVLFVALCVLVPVYAGCALLGSGTAIDWVPFVRFQGITYTLQDTKLLPSQVLGEVYDTVRFRLDGNVHDTGYQAKDGDAAYLDAGTKVYTVQGYVPTFRLAAYSTGLHGAQDLHYYDANANPQARTGSDLLDIQGKVTSIGVVTWQDEHPPDERTEVGRIADQQQISTLVQMVLDAPVDQRAAAAVQEGTRYLVVFHLRDGTIATRILELSTCTLVVGIHVPRAFCDAIATAAGGS